MLPKLRVGAPTQVTEIMSHSRATVREFTVIHRANKRKQPKQQQQADNGEEKNARRHRQLDTLVYPVTSQKRPFISTHEK